MHHHLTTHSFACAGMCSTPATCYGARTCFGYACYRCLLLLEDVDAAFVGRQAQEGRGAASSLSFSGLLNAIDGVRVIKGVKRGCRGGVGGAVALSLFQQSTTWHTDMADGQFMLRDWMRDAQTPVLHC